MLYGATMRSNVPDRPWGTNTEISLFGIASSVYHVSMCRNEVSILSIDQIDSRTFDWSTQTKISDFNWGIEVISTRDGPLAGLLL